MRTITDYRCIHCGGRDAKAHPEGWICGYCRKPWESEPVEVEAAPMRLTLGGPCSRCYDNEVEPGQDFCLNCLEIIADLGSPQDAPRFLGSGQPD